MSERIALLYSDGSIGIMPPATSIEKAREEAKDADHNETDPAYFTKVATIEINIVEVLDVPRSEAVKNCPVCGGVKPVKGSANASTSAPAAHGTSPTRSR